MRFPIFSRLAPSGVALARSALLGLLGAVSFTADAQSLVASTTSVSTNQSNAPVTLAYTPGADSGSLDFELRYTALATTSAAQVDSTIANGTLACSLPVTGRLRCTVLAGSGAADLGAGNITVVFSTGNTAGSIPITFHSAHFFSQTGAAEPGSTSAGSLALVTPPTLSIANVSTVEGNAGTTLATFTVALAPVAAGPVTFDIATDTGTAIPGVDYVPKALVGQTIPAGQASTTFTVVINGDTIVEDDETYAVRLANVSGAAVSSGGQALGKITNDDSAGLSIADASVVEGNAGLVTARFAVSLSAPMPTPVTFNIATANGSALAGNDYVATSQVARVIDAGRTSAVFEVAVNGDVAAEPDESFTVTLGNVAGAVVSDGVAIGTIVNDDGAALTTISQIQGTGLLSPLAGKAVTTAGIVTAVTGDGFFLQSADGDQDGDPASAEGIAVYDADRSVAIGDRRRVDGIVQEVQLGPGRDQLSLTRIAATRTVLLAGDQQLPRPVALDAGNTGPDRPVAALERYEGMRVSIASLDVVGPSTGIADGTTGAVHDTGRFVGVARGIARPFREPGASVLDPGVASVAVSGVRFDGNPERLGVDSQAQRGARAIATDVGDHLAGLVGVLSYARGTYQILPDADAPLAFAGGAHPRAVPAAAEGQATIATFALPPSVHSAGAGASPVTAGDAYATRLAKTANAICAFTGSPDIVAVTGVVNQAGLTELAQALNAGDGNLLFPGSCAGNPGYAAYVPGGSGAQAADMGFLLRRTPMRGGAPRVEVTSISRAGGSDVLRRPDGTPQALNEHTPLVLEAVVHGEDGRRRAVTVIAAALSVLDDDPDAPGSHGWRTRGDGTRARRLAQATFLGRLVRDRQRAQPDGNLVVLGNFEAPEFSDGRADLLGLVAGRDGVRRARGPDTDPGTRLVNLTTQLPRGERYTVVRDGNAQAVDHVLVNPAVLAASPDVHVAIARVNADFGEDNAADPGVPMRVSEHDPIVLYLDLGN